MTEWHDHFCASVFVQKDNHFVLKKWKTWYACLMWMREAEDDSEENAIYSWPTIIIKLSKVRRFNFILNVFRSHNFKGTAIAYLIRNKSWSFLFFRKRSFLLINWCRTAKCECVCQYYEYLISFEYHLRFNLIQSNQINVCSTRIYVNVGVHLLENCNNFHKRIIKMEMT